MCQDEHLIFLPAMRYRKFFFSGKSFVGKTTEKINFNFFCSDFVENKTISARLSSRLSLNKRGGGGGDGELS